MDRDIAVLYVVDEPRRRWQVDKLNLLAWCYGSCMPRLVRSAQDTVSLPLWDQGALPKDVPPL